MTKLRRAFAALCVLGVLAAPIGAQWSPGGVTGGTEHLGTAFDTVEVDQSKLRYSKIDSARQDYSVHKMIHFDLRDPAQMWDLSAFRGYEEQRSLFLQEGFRFPIEGDIVITTSQDSLLVTDEEGDIVLVFVAHYNAIVRSAGSDMAFLDGVLFESSAGNGLFIIDFAKDDARIITTGGQHMYKGNISERNANLGVLLTNASPAIVHNTCNAVSVTRSPHSGHVDQYGRRWAYWSVGTGTGGTYPGASIASYDASGTLSIYDWDEGQDDALDVFHLPGGDMFKTYSTGTQDRVGWKHRIPAITGDFVSGDVAWGNNRFGSEDLNWTNSAVFSGIAALAGQSPFNNSPRIALGSDEGLYFLDARAADNTNGSKMEVTSAYKGPVQTGVSIAWSPASTAELSGVFSTSGTTCSFTTTTDGPLSSAWRFDGVDDAVNITTTLDDLSGDTQGSWDFWIKPDDGRPSGLEWLVSWGDADANEYMYMYLANSGKLTLDCRDAGTIQWAFATTIAVFANGAGDWAHVAFVQNGVAPVLYFNGELVGITFSTSTDKTDYFASLAGLDHGYIGAHQENSNPVGGFYNGDMTPPVLTRGVLSAAEIKNIYQIGLANIQSDYDGTLHAADVDYVHADQRSGTFVAGNQDSVTVFGPDLAIQRRYGSASTGNIASAYVTSVPGQDSVSVGFGGTTGSYRNVPGMNVGALALAEWPDLGITIGGVATADSAGWGDCWKIQDCIDMQHNVDKLSVYAMRGHYHDPITAMYTNMKLWGDGPRTVVTNESDTGERALSIVADSVQISSMTFRTAPGGAGGNQQTVLVDGDGNILEGVIVEDSDVIAFIVNTGESGNVFSNCLVLDADDHAWYIDGPNNRLSNCAVFTSGASPISIAAQGDQSQVIGSWIDGPGDAIFITSLAEYQAIVGNSTDEQINDRSGTSVVVGNVQW